MDKQRFDGGPGGVDSRWISSDRRLVDLHGRVEVDAPSRYRLPSSNGSTSRQALNAVRLAPSGAIVPRQDAQFEQAVNVIHGRLRGSIA